MLLLLSQQRSACSDGRHGRADDVPPFPDAFRHIIPVVGADGARHAMSLTCSQNFLQSRLHLRRTGANAHRARQVVGGADEQGADARRRCDRIEILQALHRFDHDDGQQVAVGIERPQVGVPIVFITAFGNDATRDLALRAGAIAYLEKPFQEESLLAALKQAVG